MVANRSQLEECPKAVFARKTDLQERHIEQDNREHLYRLDSAGGKPRLLTPGEYDVEDVRLAPDKQTIYYTSNQDDVAATLVRLRAIHGSDDVALNTSTKPLGVTASDQSSGQCRPME